MICFTYITYQHYTYQQGFPYWGIGVIPHSQKICSFTLYLEQFLPPPKVNLFPSK